MMIMVSYPDSSSIPLVDGMAGSEQGCDKGAYTTQECNVLLGVKSTNMCHVVPCLIQAPFLSGRP